MKIIPIGQSGYIVKTVHAEIVIDPYLSDIVNEVAGRPRLLSVPIKPQDIRADAVICTHNHLDHLDAASIPLMRKEQLFLTTYEGKEQLEHLEHINVQPLKIGDCVMIGDVNIHAVYANHTVEAFGVLLEAEGLTLYFSGDTLYDERLFEIAEYKPDVTFICINGKLGNMSVEEALITAEKIGAKVNVPNHYDMFASNAENPALFAEHIEGGKILTFNTTYDIADMLQDTVC